MIIDCEIAIIGNWDGPKQNNKIAVCSSRTLTRALSAICVINFYIHIVPIIKYTLMY